MKTKKNTYKNLYFEGVYPNEQWHKFIPEIKEK